MRRVRRSAPIGFAGALAGALLRCKIDGFESKERDAGAAATRQKGPRKEPIMAYRIEGLASEAFESLFSMTDGELAERNAVRVTADAGGGYPCRVSLEDAAPGEELV